MTCFILYKKNDNVFEWECVLWDKLINVFGIEGFRNNQKAIINCILCKNDVFVLMPTGGGKSLTF